ncbi:MAG: type IV pilus assembly protein PilM [Actinobacteria bacterium]|nr:type IV pilus assembly protein PilM [Actinomycetota bacterium]
MSAKSAIGVNISTTCVRAAEISIHGGVLRLDRFGQVPLPVGSVIDGEVIDTHAVASALKQLWKAAHFRSRKVILGVSNQRVLVRQAELPVMDEAERRSSLRFQVADLVPMGVDEAVLDFIPMEEFDRGAMRMHRGLLVAAAQDTVLGAIAAASEAGLETIQVDLTPFAVLRSVALDGRHGRQGTAEAVVDIGARVTNIVVHENGVPRFVRVLMMGGDTITETLVDKAGLKPSEASAVTMNPQTVTSVDATLVQRVLAQALGALVDEVRSSVDYYRASSTGGALSRLVLTGGASRLPQMAERMAATMNVTVVPGTPFAGLDTSKSALTEEQLRYVEPMASVPVGLALGGLR